MKRILILVVSFLTLLPFSRSAQAGFLVEPFFQFGLSGDSEQGSTSNDLSSTIMGARLGFTTLGLMYGIEYATGTFSIDTSGGDSDGDSTDMGLFVGYEFPILVRVWLSYYLQSAAEIDGSNLKYKGSGTQIGVGYTGLPFISFNLTMLTRSYDEVESGETTLNVNPEWEHNTYLLGISLPLP